MLSKFQGEYQESLWYTGKLSKIISPKCFDSMADYEFFSVSTHLEQPDSRILEENAVLLTRVTAVIAGKEEPDLDATPRPKTAGLSLFRDADGSQSDSTLVPVALQMEGGNIVARKVDTSQDPAAALTSADRSAAERAAIIDGIVASISKESLDTIAGLP